MTLAQLTAAAPRLALVGLAKNTGKTVTLNALLGELAATREPVGVTSVGRDGEQHDVIDFRIEKPLVRLSAGDLVATTDGLLSASGVPHELLERTGVRTPLGEVLLARLKGAGTVEIAGPSAAADTRAVADSMLEQGAGRVVIDGAIDRRAASSPEVSDGLVMSTGAILSDDIEEVVARTAEAVALVRVAPLGAEGEDARVRELAAALEPGLSVLVDDGWTAHPLPERFVLTAEPASIAERLRAAGTPRVLIVAGALPQRFLDGLVPSVRRSRETLTVVVSDATRLFLWRSRRRPLRPRGHRAPRPAADRAARAHGQPRRAAVAQLRLGAAAGAARRRRSRTSRSSTCCTRPTRPPMRRRRTCAARRPSGAPGRAVRTPGDA